VLLVYSVDKYTNFQEVDKYAQQLRYHDMEGDIVKILVANKVDVSTREVSTEEGLAYAQKIGAEYVETSAKTDYNVNQAFVTLATLIRNKRKQILQEIKKESTDNIIPNEKSKSYEPATDETNDKGFMKWLFSKCNLI
jgi:GTPase SAR1 family protein